jgi:hypothetical protein
MTGNLNTADNGSYIKGELTVHYTTSPVGTPYKRVKTICGQTTRKTYFGVHETAQTVNCLKCLSA